MLKSGQGKKDDRMLLEKVNAVLLQLHGRLCWLWWFCLLAVGRADSVSTLSTPRFNHEKKPNEVCWYFPLENQIKQLLKNKNYQYQLKHEGRRTQHHDYMSDVYGSATESRELFCSSVWTHAFPWSSRKHQVRTSILNHDLNSNFQRSNLCYARTWWNLGYISYVICLHGWDIARKICSCKRSSRLNLKIKRRESITTLQLVLRWIDYIAKVSMAYVLCCTELAWTVRERIR